MLAHVCISKCDEQYKRWSDWATISVKIRRWKMKNGESNEVDVRNIRPGSWPPDRAAISQRRTLSTLALPPPFRRGIKASLNSVPARLICLVSQCFHPPLPSSVDRSNREKEKTRLATQWIESIIKEVGHEMFG